MMVTINENNISRKASGSEIMDFVDSKKNELRIRILKWASLGFLVLQNASTILLLRYTRLLPGDMYFTTTAIVVQEVLKIIFSLLFLFLETLSIKETWRQINQQILSNVADSFKTGIPAFLYTIQNNLIYVSVSNLDAAIFQVTFQLKILTTALCMRLLLNRKLSAYQWLSLLLLFIGVSTIQIQNVKSASGNDEERRNALLGLIAVLIACVLSGCAGVYFEKILKNSPVSVWIRNIQLGGFSTIIGLITAYASEGTNINSKGFFYGYNSYVWFNVVLQSLGGLLVAIVIKYADNILKGFATSIAIIVSCVASVYIFNTQINLLFGFGTLLVISATLLYSYPVQSSSTIKDTNKIDDILVVSSSSNHK